MSDIPEEVRPRRLTEEQMHSRYSVERAMKHYKEVVYPTQREGWKHGQVSKPYKDHYDQVKWRKHGRA